MTDIGRKNQMEEVENMYIMMFSLQTLQNYGISIKETIENSLVHLWRWYQQSGGFFLFFLEQTSNCQASVALLISV